MKQQKQKQRTMKNMEQAHNDLNNSMDNIIKAGKNGNDSKIDEALNKFILLCANITFKTYLEGWISDKAELIDNAKIFLRNNEIEKTEYITWMLNTYYPGSNDEIYNEILLNEEYELCGKYIKIKDIKIRPFY